MAAINRFEKPLNLPVASFQLLLAGASLHQLDNMAYCKIINKCKSLMCGGCKGWAAVGACGLAQIGINYS